MNPAHPTTNRPHLLPRLLQIIALAGMTFATTHAAETRLPVTFSGGHDTDPRDGGRPIVLVAAGLGVPTNVFRQAFSGVTPARNGAPSPEQARQNKSALMKVLAPYGITNERLDEVSNYYRYRPDRGELWKAVPARAEAVLENGAVKRIDLINAGAGYSSPPTATIKGVETARLIATLRFDKDLATNGSIAKIDVTTDNRFR